VAFPCLAKVSLHKWSTPTFCGQAESKADRGHRAESLVAAERWCLDYYQRLCSERERTPAFSVYGATKAALRSFVRTWTSDLKDRNIRANVISPGPTDTPVIDGQPADAVARIVSTIPMGRIGEPDEIAKAALFLASDDSSFITGIELFVDGGRGQI
jgi:NAD(P)-dependent dehydrogenase (short-subunit alcohol dehydrogenase family)